MGEVPHVRAIDTYDDRMRRQPTYARRVAPSTRPRPNYGRLCLLLLSVALTVGTVAVAALGLSPYPRTEPAAAVVPAQHISVGSAEEDPAQDTTGVDVPVQAAAPTSPAVPARSGHGRRVVFDMSQQRVWLVGPAGRVARTYLVSGSRVGNLHAGRFEVYSRSRHAVGYTGATTMDYMVRFTQGENAAIGFHDIPVDSRGRPVQGLDELGTPTSAGCIRQRTADAKAMWSFAQEGTDVVVVD